MVESGRTVLVITRGLRMSGTNGVVSSGAMIALGAILRLFTFLARFLGGGCGRCTFCRAIGSFIWLGFAITVGMPEDDKPKVT